jgi:hypothetical protein
MLLSLAAKAEVDFRYRRVNEEDHINIDFRAFHGLWHTQFQIPTLQLKWEGGPQVEVEQKSSGKGGTRKAKTKARFRYLRREWLLRLWPKIPRLLDYLKQVKNDFYRGIHCEKINWRVEIGLKDASQTAIAAGAFWSMFGFAMTHLYRQVTVDVSQPALIVIPQFKKEIFFCDLQCIFRLRIGHIIFVGFNLLRALKRGLRG